MKNKMIDSLITKHFLQIALAVSFSIFVIIPSVQAEETVQAAGVTPEEVIILVNKERDGVALPELYVNDALSQAASDKVKDMFKNQYFQHTSPDGLTPWYWMEKNNYDYKAAGENLAIAFGSAQNQHYSWMKSDRHRKNILSKEYTDIGVAVATGVFEGERTTITVQMFGRQMTQPTYIEQQAASVSRVVEGIDTKLQSFEMSVTDKNKYGVYRNIQIIRNNSVFKECAWTCIAIVCLCTFLIDSILIFKMNKIIVS